MNGSTEILDVYIFKTTFEDILKSEGDKLIKTLSTAINAKELELEQVLKVDLSYDQAMKCLRCKVQDFAMRAMIGELGDMNTDGLSHYSHEDCLGGMVRMHFTVFKNDLPHDNSTDWLDIDLEEIISKAIGKKLTT